VPDVTVGQQAFEQILKHVAIELSSELPLTREATRVLSLSVAPPKKIFIKLR
jgi:hypothetical protein